MSAKWKALIIAACALSVIALGVSASGSKTKDHALILKRVPGVTAICIDDTYSTSRRDRGTCSKHGGVKEWLIK